MSVVKQIESKPKTSQVEVNGSTNLSAKRIALEVEANSGNSIRVQDIYSIALDVALEDTVFVSKLIKKISVL